MEIYDMKSTTKKAPWFIAQQAQNPTPPKPPSWLHRKSAKQRERDVKYEPVRKAYLKTHTLCEVCVAEGRERPHPATEIHHKRGRVGALMCDPKYFMAVCREDHYWIDTHKAEARRRGYLCALGEWGRQP